MTRRRQTHGLELGERDAAGSVLVVLLGELAPKLQGKDELRVSCCTTLKAKAEEAHALAQRLVWLVLGADSDERVVLVLPRWVLRRLEVQLAAGGRGSCVSSSSSCNAQSAPERTLKSFMSPRPSDSCRPVCGFGRGAALSNSASGRLTNRGQFGRRSRQAPAQGDLRRLADIVVAARLVPVEDRELDSVRAGRRAQRSVSVSSGCAMLQRRRRPNLSNFLQWKRSFSSHWGLSSCRMTRVRKIFLPKLTTTKGSMSKLGVGAGSQSVARAHSQSSFETHPILKAFFSRGRSSAPLISSMTTPRISESVE